MSTSGYISHSLDQRANQVWHQMPEAGGNPASTSRGGRNDIDTPDGFLTYEATEQHVQVGSSKRIIGAKRLYVAPRVTAGKHIAFYIEENGTHEAIQGDGSCAFAAAIKAAGLECTVANLKGEIVKHAEGSEMLKRAICESHHAKMVQNGGGDENRMASLITPAHEGEHRAGGEPYGVHRPHTEWSTEEWESLYADWKHEIGKQSYHGGWAELTAIGQAMNIDFLGLKGNGNYARETVYFDDGLFSRPLRPTAVVVHSGGDNVGSHHFTALLGANGKPVKWRLERKEHQPQDETQPLDQNHQQCPQPQDQPQHSPPPAPVRKSARLAAQQQASNIVPPPPEKIAKRTATALRPIAPNISVAQFGAVNTESSVISSSDASVQGKTVGLAAVVAGKPFYRTVKTTSKMSSTEAEYGGVATAVLMGTTDAATREKSTLIVFTDSEVLTSHVEGKYRVEATGTKRGWNDLMEAVEEAGQRGWQVQIVQIPREYNEAADKVAGYASKRGSPTPSPQPYPVRLRKDTIPSLEWLAAHQAEERGDQEKENVNVTDPQASTTLENRTSVDSAASPSKRKPMTKAERIELRRDSQQPLLARQKQAIAAGKIKAFAKLLTKEMKDKAVGEFLDSFVQVSPSEATAAVGPRDEFLWAAHNVASANCIGRTMERITSAGLYSERHPGEFNEQFAKQLPPMEPAEEDAPTIASIALGLPKDLPRVTFTPQEVKAVIERKDDATSPGLEKMGYADVKALAADDAALRDLTDLLEWIANDEISNPDIRDRLRKALGVGIKKTNGDLRVIAVGNVLISLVGSLIARRLRDHVRDRFSPTNLGLASAGVDKAMAAVTIALKLNKEAVAVKLDITNAFNEGNRLRILQLLAKPDQEGKLTPLAAAIPYFLFRYRESVDIDFTLPDGKSVTGKSERGFVPGDPMGPILFTILMASFLDSLKVRFPDTEVLAVSYLDDITLAGTPEEVMVYLEEIKSSLHKETGLRLNMRKSEAWRERELSPGEASALQQHEVKVVESNRGLELLGSAIGSDDFVKEVLQRKVEEIQEAADILVRVHDTGRKTGISGISAGSFRALSWIIASKFTHHLRQINQELTREFAIKVEKIQLSVAATILGCERGLLDKPGTRERIMLPVKLGGLGLTASSEVAPLARVAGYMSSEELLLDIFRASEEDPDAPSNTERLRNAMAGLQAAFARAQEVDDRRHEGLDEGGPTFELEIPKASGKGLQKKFCDALHQQRLDDIVQKMSEWEKKIFTESILTPEASTWLTGPLGVPKVFRMTETEFVDACYLRAGLPLRGCEYIKEGTCIRCCTTELEGLEANHHPLTCSKNAKGHRHNLCNKALMSTIPRVASGSVTAAKEVFVNIVLRSKPKNGNVDSSSIANDCPADSPSKRNRPKQRADLVLYKDAGVKYVIDLTIGSLSRSDKISARKTDQLESHKTAEYSHYELESKFVPFAGDSYGAIGKAGKTMVEALVPPPARGESCKRREVYWRYTLALARGNSGMISQYIRECASIKLHGNDGKEIGSENNAAGIYEA